MNKQKTLVVALCIGAASTLNAQESKRGPYETNKFFDNWFISAGGGVNLYEGEEDNQGKLGKRLAPTWDFSLGKWVTPAVGLRLQYSGGEAKGNTSLMSDFMRPGSMYKNLYREKFRLSTLHLDIMWNATNSLAGYSSSRVWNVIPFVGFGNAQSRGNGNQINEFALAAGILNTFRVSDRIDINLEARQMIMRDNQDGVVFGKSVDGMTSLTAGITVKLGKTKFNRVKAVEPDYSAYTDQIKQMANELAERKRKEEELRQFLADEKKRASLEKILTKTVASPVALFFTIGKNTLDSKELLNLDFYVKTAMAEDSDRTFTLIGSADKETGTAKFNEELTQKRVDFVYNLLVNKYGINPSKLIKKPEGSNDNRFNSPELNRVVIIE